MKLRQLKLVSMLNHFYTENTCTNYQASILAVDPKHKSEFYVNLQRIKQGHDLDDVFSI